MVTDYTGERTEAGIVAWVTRKAQPAVRALPVPPSATWHPTRSLSPITLPDLYCMPQLHRARAFSAHASQTHSAPLKLRSCWPGGGAGQPGGGRRVQSQDRDRNGVLRSKPPPPPRYSGQFSLMCESLSQMAQQYPPSMTWLTWRSVSWRIAYTDLPSPVDRFSVVILTVIG